MAKANIWDNAIEEQLLILVYEDKEGNRSWKFIVDSDKSYMEKYDVWMIVDPMFTVDFDET